jgi:hypothetical protein
MNKSGILWREVALWIIAFVLIFFLISFLIGLPFLKWISFLPGDSFDGIEDEFVEEDEEVIPSQDDCEVIGRLSEKSEGWIGSWAPFVDRDQDKRQIILNNNLGTPLYITGYNLENAEIYVNGINLGYWKSNEIKIGEIDNYVIYFENYLFNGNSLLWFKLWFNVFSRYSFSKQGDFKNYIVQLEGARINNQLQFCKGDFSEGFEERDFTKMNVQGVFDKDQHFYFDSNSNRYLNNLNEKYFYTKAKYFYLDKDDGFAWIYAKQSWSDNVIGILFRDGSVWIDEDLEEYFDGLEFNDNLFVNEYKLLKGFLETNLLVSEDDLRKYFASENE